MSRIKRINFTKKDLSNQIAKKTGLPNFYIYKILNDFIFAIKNSIKTNEIKIKNFGSFRIIQKKERVGRNPKNKKEYKIAARKSLSFISSKKINKILNRF